MLLRRYYTGNLAASAPAAGVSMDADTTALVARMTSAPDSTRQNLINNLIVDAKADGWWTKLDWFVALAAHDSQASLLNWKPGSKAMTTAGTITFDTNLGYRGDGSTGYLTFGEAYNAGGNQYALNSCSLGAYCNQQNGVAGNRVHMGDLEASLNRVRFNAASGGAAETWRLNASVNTNAPVSTTRTGHRTIVRTDSSNNHFYKGGVKTSSTQASANVPTAHGSVLRALTEYCADRMAVVYFGTQLTDGDVANINTRVSTFLTAIGAN
jgi:hypothetical protein